MEKDCSRQNFAIEETRRGQTHKCRRHVGSISHHFAALSHLAADCRDV